MGRRVRTCLALLVSAITFAGATACSVIPEEKIVRDFFRASRLRDNAALGAFATTNFDPNRDGQVTEFKVLSVSPEHTAPLPLKKYDDAFDEASASQKAFAREKYEFQQTNLEAIERIEKLEAKNAPCRRRTPPSRRPGRSGATTRPGTSRRCRMRASPCGRMKGVAELSLSQPNGPTPDVAHYVGDVIEKDITIDAKVQDARRTDRPEEPGGHRVAHRHEEREGRDAHRALDHHERQGSAGAEDIVETPFDAHGYVRAESAPLAWRRGTEREPAASKATGSPSPPSLAVAARTCRFVLRPPARPSPASRTLPAGSSGRWKPHDQPGIVVEVLDADRRCPGRTARGAHAHPGGGSATRTDLPPRSETGAGAASSRTLARPPPRPPRPYGLVRNS